jgi:hypothetical protein
MPFSVFGFRFLTNPLVFARMHFQSFQASCFVAYPLVNTRKPVVKDLPIPNRVKDGKPSRFSISPLQNAAPSVCSWIQHGSYAPFGAFQELIIVIQRPRSSAQFRTCLPVNFQDGPSLVQSHTRFGSPANTDLLTWFYDDTLRLLFRP